VYTFFWQSLYMCEYKRNAQSCTIQLHIFQDILHIRTINIQYTTVLIYYHFYFHRILLRILTRVLWRICNDNQISIPRKHTRFWYCFSQSSGHYTRLMMAWLMVLVLLFTKLWILYTSHDGLANGFVTAFHKALDIIHVSWWPG